MQNLTVSVVIAVRNGQDYLPDAIESVIGQSRRPDEIIVVDGNSTDNTATIARSFAEVTYVLQHSQGLANARNTGIRQSKGDLIAFLDSDDYWVKEKLEVQIQQFISDPEIQYSYSRLKFFLEPGCVLRNGYTASDLSREQTGYTPGSLVAYRNLFRKIGTFDPSYKIACDLDWFNRVKDHKIKAGFVPQVLLYKRLHNKNLSGNVAAHKREIFNVLRKSLDRNPQ